MEDSNLGPTDLKMSYANFVPQRFFFPINFNASDLILILTNLSSSHGVIFWTDLNLYNTHSI